MRSHRWFTPWLLLRGVVSARALAPGAVLFGIVMLLVRPVTSIWLTRALESSANRYGSIGVAFTYLAWLYVIAWILLATAVVGQVLVTDHGRIGRFHDLADTRERRAAPVAGLL